LGQNPGNARNGCGTNPGNWGKFFPVPRVKEFLSPNPFPEGNLWLKNFKNPGKIERKCSRNQMKLAPKMGREKG